MLMQRLFTLHKSSESMSLDELPSKHWCFELTVSAHAVACVVPLWEPWSHSYCCWHKDSYAKSVIWTLTTTPANSFCVFMCSQGHREEMRSSALSSGNFPQTRQQFDLSPVHTSKKHQFEFSNIYRQTTHWLIKTMIHRLIDNEDNR